MFSSHCLLSRQGPLGAIWVAAYFYKKLKKSQVTSISISSSVDKILRDEYDDAITCRVLAYLLLGVVRIYSKKVDYLFNDCNKAMRNIRNFVLKYGTNVESLRAPYFSVTRPERFELDAFDLDILGDATGRSNVVPHDEITLKDVAWNAEGIGKYGVEQYDFEKFPSVRDSWSTGCTLDDISLSQHMECDMEVVASPVISTARASMDKFEGNKFSGIEEEPPESDPLLCEIQQTGREDVKVQEGVVPEVMIPSTSESMDLGTLGRVEKEPLTPIRCSKLHDDEEQMEIPGIAQSANEVLAPTSMMEASNDRCCEEVSVNLENFEGVEKERVILVQPFDESNQTDGLLISVHGTPQIEMRQTIDDRNGNNLEPSIEKLLENRREDIDIDMDTEMFCAVEKPPEFTHPFNEDHRDSAEMMKLLEETSLGSKKDQIIKEDSPLSMKLDVSPPPKFPNDSVVTTPEFLNIPTPAAKEGAWDSKARARARRKRKYQFDDIIVIPNHLLKQLIEDASDLVCKRRKVPLSALAAWKAQRVSSHSRCFLHPLIPCTSLDLISLSCEKKQKMILKSVESSNLQQKPASESAAFDRSVENAELSEKLCMSEHYTVNRSSKTEKPIEGLNVPKSPIVDRSFETVEPLGRLDTMTAQSPGVAEFSQNECHSVIGLVAQSVKLPEKLHMPESPTASESLVKTPIAPQTPILHKTSSRPFESPERPEIFYTEGEKIGLENLEKESCLGKDQGSDSILPTEEINSFEGDDADHYGWSQRTSVVARCLHCNFLHQQKRSEKEVVNLVEILETRSKKESARFFYEVLVLKSNGYLHVKQENEYGDILVWKTSRWGQSFAAD